MRPKKFQALPLHDADEDKDADAATELSTLLAVGDRDDGSSDDGLSECIDDDDPSLISRDDRLSA